MPVSIPAPQALPSSTESAKLVPKPVPPVNTGTEPHLPASTANIPALNVNSPLPSVPPAQLVSLSAKTSVSQPQTTAVKEDTKTPTETANSVPPNVLSAFQDLSVRPAPAPTTSMERTALRLSVSLSLWS